MKKRTQGNFTGCSLKSAGRSLWARHANSTAAHSIGWRNDVAARIASLGLLLAAWVIAAHFAGGRMLPDPQSVVQMLIEEARSGALAMNIGATLLRVAAAFVIAMAIGSAAGLLMGRFPVADRLGDPWLIVLLNLPALV